MLPRRLDSGYRRLVIRGDRRRGHHAKGSRSIAKFDLTRSSLLPPQLLRLPSSDWHGIANRLPIGWVVVVRQKTAYVLPTFRAFLNGSITSHGVQQVSFVAPTLVARSIALTEIR